MRTNRKFVRAVKKAASQSAGCKKERQHFVLSPFCFGSPALDGQGNFAERSRGKIIFAACPAECKASFCMKRGKNTVFDTLCAPRSCVGRKAIQGKGGLSDISQMLDPP